jgi:hypothetical protein
LTSATYPIHGNTTNTPDPQQPNPILFRTNRTPPQNKHSSSSTPEQPATRSTCSTTPDTTSPQVLRAWLAAAHGEALAAHGDHTASLHAFDRATDLLPSDPTDERPYVALDPVHLARWRGHALARFGHPDVITVLTGALNRLDPTFVRAETALRVDLATALAANGDRDEARTHADHAAQLAAQVGSARQRRRITTLLAAV